MIRWDEVTVSFGPKKVLGPVTLQVGDGEWVGLIGPNGAGKSTMLKAASSTVAVFRSPMANGGPGWTSLGCRKDPRCQMR